MKHKILNTALFCCTSLVLFSCVPGTSSDKTSLKFAPNNKVTTSTASSADSVKAYKETLYPVLNSMSCVNCHGDKKLYQPYYLVSNVEESWKTILIDSKKVNLESPEASRVYLRIKNDKHNCLSGVGDSDCEDEAAKVLEAIQKWKKMVNANASAGIKTDPIQYVSAESTIPEIENGTFLIEAEQDDFPEAMVGRFTSESDGQASGYKYANTATPAANPTTAAVRTASILKGNACEVTTDAMLSSAANGPYRISEEGTHINSGYRTPTTNVLVKDGHRPFSIAFRSVLIRPDKRMEYAKMLTGWTASSISGTPNIANLNSIALTDGNFDLSDINLTSGGRTIKSAIDLSNYNLLGTLYSGVSFKTLPYFAERDLVFELSPSNLFLNTPDVSIPNLSGGTLLLKNLFKQPTAEITPKNIQTYFYKNEQTSTNQFRRDILYRFIKTQLDSFLASNFRYKRIVNMTSSHFYSLYPNLKINITACPSNVCTSTTQDIEITPGSDSNGVALTYANALDILKVNAAGTGFISGTLAELQSGIAFRRIDVYAHHYLGTNAYTYGDEFDQTFYSFDGTSFTEKAKINYPINPAAQNIDLKAVYSNSSSTISKDDSLQNFQNTLYPVLRASSCINCHDGSVAARMPHSSVNPVVAFNAIDRNQLVDFMNPSRSFRRALFPAESSIVHNCGTPAQCTTLQNQLTTAITAWKTANDAILETKSSEPFTSLTAKERTPGMLQYTFKAKQSGLYNVWLKVKGLRNSRINLRILDVNGNPINSNSKIAPTTVTTTSCVGYTFPVDYNDWGWYTPGRENDLSKLDPLGKLKKDSNGNLLSLSDNRTYWRLDADKTYTLQIFEQAPGTKIDLVAVDLVKNLTDILDFQPDLLARDENNISNYKRKILKYDISKLVGLPVGSAHFLVEVQSALGGSNYIFRNPRIVSPSANIYIKGIKVFINGATSFADASWNAINLYAGDGQIMTYASLLALVPNNSSTDFFQFSFDAISKSANPITALDPRGTGPVIIEGRKCRDLDLFINTVKPILRNARLMYKENDGIAEYYNDFPRKNRQATNQPQTYQCMSCHNATHPYFKMTTFDYPELLCAQALSRVDFSSYRDSLLVRGLNGTGTHPKLHFVEELQYNAGQTAVLTYNEEDGTKILSGMFKNQFNSTDPAYFSKWIANYYFPTYTRSDLGLGTNWASFTTDQKEYARNFVGQFKRISYTKLPDLRTQPYYEEFAHSDLIGEIQVESDDIVAGLFPNAGGSYNMYTTYIPLITDTQTTIRNMPYDVRVQKNNGKLILASGNKTFETTETATQLDDKAEALKEKYRTVIMNWIAREHELSK